LNEKNTPIKIDISKIRFRKCDYPRVKLDRDTVVRYKELYESGAKVDPIIIQKERYGIDGKHRLQAQKELGWSQVDVIIKEISANEIYLESIRLNSQHGKQFDKKDRDEQIFKLRTEFHWGFKKIGIFVGLEKSGAKRAFDKKRILKGLSAQNAKDFDQRRKVDHNEVIKKWKDNMQQVDIARDLGVTEPRISQILRPLKEAQKSSVAILCTPYLLKAFCRYALVDGYLDETVADIVEGGIFVNAYKKNLGVSAFFADDYFQHFKADEQICWRFKDIRSQVEAISRNSDFIQLSLSNEQMKLIGKSATFSTGDITLGYRPLPNMINKLTKEGTPKNPDTSFILRRHHLNGMPKMERVIIDVKDGTLRIGGEDRGWITSKKMSTDVNGKDLIGSFPYEGFKAVWKTIERPYLGEIEFNILLDKTESGKEDAVLHITFQKERCWVTFILIGEIHPIDRERGGTLLQSQVSHLLPQSSQSFSP
jgi:hypothetical protein